MWLRFCAVASCLFIWGCGDDATTPGSDAGIDAPAVDVRIPDGPSQDYPPLPDGTPRDGFTHFGDGGHCMGPDGGAGGNRTLYLNFDGVALVTDPLNNDSRTNHTFLVPASVTVPQFLAGSGQRTATIAGIVAQLRDVLGPYDVQVVTDRPTTAGAEYLMVVFGGTSNAITGRPNLGAFGPVDCQNANQNDIGLVFDPTGSDITVNIVGSANAAMFVIGLSIGLSSTQQTGDCMSTMSSTSAACVLGDMVSVGQSVGCPDAQLYQDDQAGFTAAFGCR
jgi:hypothetical protein